MIWAIYFAEGSFLLGAICGLCWLRFMDCCFYPWSIVCFPL